MKKFAVLGNPIKHSRSPQIHQRFAQSAGIEVSYDKVLVEPDQFIATAKAFFAAGGDGFNITVPNKFDAFELVDSVDLAAKTARAVNTVKLGADGKLAGFNTDGAGMIKDMLTRLNWQIKDKRVLVLGAGGAVQGVMANLLQETPALVHIYNRTAAKAEQLVDHLKALALHEGNVTSLALDELEAGYDIIISGSSAGLSADANGKIAGSVLPEKIVAENSHCYDMIYGATATPFMNHCSNLGAKHVSDGFGMLVEQAALAFEIWTGVEVQTEAIYQDLKSQL